ncbi:hypothetical protein TcasGA2_TC005694 [Tribolium castaneum]|uniref:Uncharacterized protein n=1 Tax=Tribolium castaneum TaxID=7070 RepID=D6WWR7_TRICA|nr:hypothetical protein TcasGA2_TC005694 [Tribolium castaneum]
MQSTSRHGPSATAVYSLTLHTSHFVSMPENDHMEISPIYGRYINALEAELITIKSPWPLATPLEISTAPSFKLYRREINGKIKTSEARKLHY